MSIAERYKEAQNLIVGNKRLLKDRRIYGLGIIIAGNIVGICESRLDSLPKSRHVSIKDDKEWEAAGKILTTEEIKALERCIFDELNYLGYEGVIRNVAGYDKSITLSVKDVTS